MSVLSEETAAGYKTKSFCPQGQILSQYIKIVELYFFHRHTFDQFQKRKLRQEYKEWTSSRRGRAALLGVVMILVGCNLSEMRQGLNIFLVLL